jgi:hypothetical protein
MRSDADARSNVLYAGVHLGGVMAPEHRLDDDEGRATVARAYGRWRKEIRQRATVDPGQRFDNPPRCQFEASLHRLADAYDVSVVSVGLFRPRQLAPAVVVRSTNYEALARATPAILRALDPKRRTDDDRTGWRWEAFSFQAVDERGVPFLAAFNFWRGPHAGGGRWARSDPLFPFEHG